MSQAILEWESAGGSLHIRELAGTRDFKDAEEIQRLAWGFEDIDVVPSAQLIAAKSAGGIVLGAFQDKTLVGFVYAFPGYEKGHATLHSHMLAVRPADRGKRAGLMLKAAQRQLALERGIREITWTFDPLQTVNASLNFTRLGVLSDQYIPNFYGEGTSSPLHSGVGTDRLWVRWLLSSQRVKHRAAAAGFPCEGSKDPLPQEPVSIPLATVDLAEPGPAAFGGEGDHWVRISQPGAHISYPHCLVEIPLDIESLKRDNIDAARAWRTMVQSFLVIAFGSGFVARDFLRLGSARSPRGFYWLSRASLEAIAGPAGAARRL